METAAKQYSVDIKCGARVTGIKTMPINPTSTSTSTLASSATVPLTLSIPLPVESIQNKDISDTDAINITADSDIGVKSNNSNKKSKTIVKVTPPIEATQFVVTYVTSTSAVFDTMKNSKISSNKIPPKEDDNNGNEEGEGDGEGDENRRPKEEKTLICDKVIFATGGSRYVPEK